MVGWRASPYGVTWWLDPDPPTKCIHLFAIYRDMPNKRHPCTYLSEVK